MCCADTKKKHEPKENTSRMEPVDSVDADAVLVVSVEVENIDTDVDGLSVNENQQLMR